MNAALSSLDADAEPALPFPTTAPERRALDRRTASGRCTIHRGEQESLRAELLDLSADGACVWTSVPLTPSESVQLDLPTRRLTAIQAPAVVVDARRVDSAAWRIGLSFQRRLQPEQLAAALD